MYRIGIWGETGEIKRLEEAFRRFSRRENVRLSIKTGQALEQLKEEIQGGQEYDVLFLRILPGDLRAIQLGRRLREEKRNFHTQLIYLAEREFYSRELIKTLPLDFYVEEEGKETAEELLKRAISVIKKSSGRFEFRLGRNYYSLPLKDILYFCSDLRRIKVKTPIDVFEFNGLLREVKERLPGEFLVIHKSFIINRNHVLQYNGEMVTLTDGTTLSISKTNRNAVKAFLMAGR